MMKLEQWLAKHTKYEGECRVWTGALKKTPSPNYMLPWAGFGGRAQSAARVAWLRAGKTIPEGGHVLHKCHNCLCVNPEHLYIGDHEQNMLDMKRAGRVNGSNGAATDTQLREMHSLRKQGWNNVRIGAALGMHHKSVSRILNGGHHVERQRMLGLL